jgi:hypothetical protein
MAATDVPHILAAIVYEPVDCAVDLVQNLNRLAPESLVALYVDARYADEYARRWPRRGLRAVMIPETRAVAKPRRQPMLHEAFFEILRWAHECCRFDALTMVDSDQLLVSAGFADTVARFLRAHPRVGLLGSASVQERQGPDSRFYLARRAYEELDLWRPFLAEFRDWESSFVHFSFWPSIVVPGRVVGELLGCLDSSAALRALLDGTQTSAINEVLLPTMVRLLGWQVAPSPASFRYCRWREPLTLEEAAAALADPSCYWIHPVTRTYDDAVRSFVRDAVGYPPPPTPAGIEPSGAIASSASSRAK